MTYGSVCSGIEAATVAWHPLGWRPAFFSEIEPFPKRVLAHHWPSVPDLGDFTKIEGHDDPVDLLVGGTPCQSFSVAGLRQGLADPRGNLMLEFGALARRLRARWLVWENVPGVLSSGEGRDFGSFLGMLAELGYGFAYRVLDAQFFGVAQRRRRVFVVGHAGGLWQRAAAVLFEPESLRGDPAPRREAGSGVASSTDIGTDISHALGAHGGIGRLDPNGESLIPFDPIQITSAANRSRCEPGSAMHTLPAAPAAPAVAFHLTQDPINGEVTPAMSGGNREGCAALGVMVDLYNGSLTGGVGATLSRASGTGTGTGPSVLSVSAVRRLTPRECERLQGFPDDYTAIPGAKDSPRYKALGNSMAVPVMRWIGQRIQMVEEACP